MQPNARDIPHISIESALPVLIMTVSLTFTCACIANIFAEYDQQDAMFLKLFFSVRPILLPAASQASLAAGSSNGLTNACFELPMIDEKTV